MSKWNQRFVGKAQHISEWSKDPSMKVGCVLVNPKTQTTVAEGFNGFPRGVREEAPSCADFATEVQPDGQLDPERWARPAKYDYVEHAERNAIYNAAREGHATEGCWAYLNFSPEDICAPCARALIQAGIVHVIGPASRAVPKYAGAWYAGRAVGQEMLIEAGVRRTVIIDNTNRRTT